MSRRENLKEKKNKYVCLSITSVYVSRDSASEPALSPYLSKSASLTYLSVYDSRDRTSEPVLSPSPLFSLTDVHRCLGYHNPNRHSLPESERQTNLSVYDSRDGASESALSPSPPSSLMLVHIGGVSVIVTQTGIVCLSPRD